MALRETKKPRLRIQAVVFKSVALEFMHKINESPGKQIPLRIREAFFGGVPVRQPVRFEGLENHSFFSSGRAITEQQFIFQSRVPPHNPYTDAHVHQET